MSYKKSLDMLQYIALIIGRTQIRPFQLYGVVISVMVQINGNQCFHMNY